jgi:pentatricopeptide repeat protein
LEVAVLVGNVVITMFVKCGSIQDAWKVFDNMKVWDVISWTAMSEGYAEYRPHEKTLEVFEQMQSLSVKPDMMTFIGHFNACASQCCAGLRICYRYPLVIHPAIYPLTQQGWKNQKIGFGVGPWFSIFLKIQKIIFLTGSSLPVLSWELLILWCSWINWNQQFSYLDFLSSKNQNQWLFDSENFKEPNPPVISKIK